MNPTTSRSPSFILCAASSAKSLSKPPPSTRCFSSTPSCAGRKKYKPPTRQRRGLYRWLTQTGSHLYAPAFGSTNYLSAYDASGRLKRVVEARAKEAAELELKGEVVQYDSAGNPILDKKAKIPPETTRDLTPFPLNKRFISQPVLSDEFREMIYSQIMVEGKSVRDVSVEFNVDMRRVGAVVRLKEVEKQWQASNKELATRYHKAVMGMLPKTQLERDPEKMTIHESINDLPVHKYTLTQIFHPTSESRRFTRADAAKAFHETLLPADQRIPHPDMIIRHKEVLDEVPEEERERRLEQRRGDEEYASRMMHWKQQEKEKKTVVNVDIGKTVFRFTKTSVEDIGRDGRGHKGVGHRYGHPMMDRKRGQVKIPTSV